MRAMLDFLAAGISQAACAIRPKLAAIASSISPFSFASPSFFSPRLFSASQKDTAHSKSSYISTLDLVCSMPLAPHISSMFPFRLHELPKKGGTICRHG
ncbi:MAG: hypothetical protein HYX24_06470 [Candidatus Aenigmarchaeota archaeon]|nr:hypothetical protein [Candidatus Aenigmarchaeota archaeon]